MLSPSADSILIVRARTKLDSLPGPAWLLIGLIDARCAVKICVDYRGYCGE
jgi:hypothetical protein